MARRGQIQKRVLLLLLSGVCLAMTRSPKRQFRIIKDAVKEWKAIDKKSLENAVKSLYTSRLLEQKSNKDGTFTLVLSNEGKRQALTYNIDTMQIEKCAWDNKWRIVTFDVPEKLKKVRDAFRYHLKNLGFKELHRSVFVLPYECRDEIEYIVEFYNARRFIRYIEATHIDNDLAIKREFGLV